MDHSGHEHAAQHDHSHGGDDGDCQFHHALVFHGGVCQEILFPGWRTHDALSVLLSALALLAAGFLYEGLKYWRERLQAAGAPRGSRQDITKSECGAAGSCQPVVRRSMWSGAHAVQTALHVLQSAASYTLMLVFMTYNVWLCAALVLGLGLGYFVFGWRKTQLVDSNEHCQ